MLHALDVPAVLLGGLLQQLSLLRRASQGGSSTPAGRDSSESAVIATTGPSRPAANETRRHRMAAHPGAQSLSTGMVGRAWMGSSWREPLDRSLRQLQGARCWHPGWFLPEAFEADGFQIREARLAGDVVTNTGSLWST